MRQVWDSEELVTQYSCRCSAWYHVSMWILGIKFWPNFLVWTHASSSLMQILIPSLSTSKSRHLWWTSMPQLKTSVPMTEHWSCLDSPSRNGEDSKMPSPATKLENDEGLLDSLQVLVGIRSIIKAASICQQHDHNHLYKFLRSLVYNSHDRSLI